MGKNAFTLIELLVVIAIMATLAAILFPVFVQAKVAAQQTACLSNIKQLTMGISMYGADSDDFYPIGGWQFPNNTTTPTYSDRWYQDVSPYTHSTQIRNCPAGTFSVNYQRNWGTDYGLNVSLAPWEASINASLVSHPSDLVMLTDAAQFNAITLSISLNNDEPTNWASYATGDTDYQVEGPYVFNPDGTGYYPYALPPDAVWDNYRRPYGVHAGNRANVGFCDGHAHSVEISALIGPMVSGYPLSDPRNYWSNE